MEGNNVSTSAVSVLMLWNSLFEQGAYDWVKLFIGHNIIIYADMRTVKTSSVDVQYLHLR